MRTEARLFSGVALFFAATAVLYGWWSAEPAGTAALTVAFLMASLVAFFFRVQHHKRGPRAQDLDSAEVVDSAGPLDFFPPHSLWPITIALGAVVLALGIVYGLWLALIGFGVLALAVCGLVFQYAGQGAQRPSSPEEDSPSGSSTSTRSP
ncbi:cytochrome c oxidase subunit 4 [Streptomyces flaveolus]|uniref:cytochrome c oxidase subunit 4 n=1 Tax=Streptomyces flaveolus TaxID=67297 RepID=UPI0033F12029